MPVCALRVGPLYQHVFPPAAAPTLSFVGLPWKVVPFCQYELQSKWIARCLSGRAQLPHLAGMRADVAAFYARLEAEGVPKRWVLSSTDPLGVLHRSLICRHPVLHYNAST